MNKLPKIVIKIDSISNEIQNSHFKNKSIIYNWHNYWSRKSPELASLIISNLCPKNGVFCDPFMGSGVHVIEAVKLNRKTKAIGIEINELPIEITLSSVRKNINSAKILNEFNSIIKNLEEKYEEYYSAFCPKCGIKAEYDKGLLRKVGKDFELEKIKINCPNCKHKIFFDADKKNIKSFNYYNKQSLKINLKDKFLDQNSRIAIKEDMKISSLFTNRNFLIMSKIKESIFKVKDKNIKKELLLIYSSMIHLAKLTDIRSQSQFPYWIPSRHILERNLLLLFGKRLSKYLDHKRKVNDEIKYDIPIVNTYNNLQNSNNAIYIVRKPIQNIFSKDIPDRSIDFILTDPPYYDQVAYSEYLKLWEFFTRFKSDLNNEIVVTRRIKQPKNHDMYFKMLKEAFKKIYRIMKISTCLAMYFNDSKLPVWFDFLEMMNKIGFHFIRQTYVPKNLNTYKQLNSPKGTLKGECLLFFYKGSRESKIIKQVEDKNKVKNIENIVKEHIIDLFRKKENPITTSLIYNSGLIHKLYNKGLLKLLSRKDKSLVDTIKNYCDFDCMKNRWLLKNKYE